MCDIEATQRTKDEVMPWNKNIVKVNWGINELQSPRLQFKLKRKCILKHDKFRPKITYYQLKKFICFVPILTGCKIKFAEPIKKQNGNFKVAKIVTSNFYLNKNEDKIKKL